MILLMKTKHDISLTQEPYQSYNGMMDQKTISGTRSTLHGQVEKKDLNRYGLMHGGRLLTLCDEVGYIAAMKHADTDCLTRAAHDIQFLSMLKKGEPYTVYAKVILTGRTTLWVSCSVKSTQKSIMNAVFVYIAVDDNFKSKAVSKINAENKSEQQEQEKMLMLMNRVKA